MLVQQITFAVLLLLPQHKKNKHDHKKHALIEKGYWQVTVRFDLRRV